MSATEESGSTEAGDGPILSVQDVVVRFGGIVALDGVSFDMPGGIILGLIGPNGEPADDFRLDDRGLLIEDQTVATAIVLALDNIRGRWWADSDHGSRIAELIAGTPSPDVRAALETATREALAPLERDGLIRDVAIHAETEGHRARVTVTVLDVGQGVPVTVEIASP